MLSLAMVTWPARSSAICSSAGAICLQRPHHSAQKSTSTGPVAFSTSCSKVSSVTATVLVDQLPWRRDASRAFRVAHLGGADGTSTDPSNLVQRLGHEFFWHSHELRSVRPD